MSIIVQKFGGTSVADTERIKNVAKFVKKEVDAGNKVAVIVSAMAGTTNQLVDWVKEVSPLISQEEHKEYDAVISSGEQITAGLLALCLQSQGIPARSWLGWQLALKTDDTHSKARILEIKTDDIMQSLNKGEVAVIAGFQGITDDGRIATLGRGGSDTSAVAVAATLNAKRCDIYTDVDGVYTCDPRIVSKAHKLDKISYEEMLEMASLGAKVLQTRSVEMAMRHGVCLRVLSSFDEDISENKGTYLVDEEEIMEKNEITGIAYSRDEARITLTKVADRPGIASDILGPLAETEINVDMIVQNSSVDGKETDFTFTVGKADINNSKSILEKNKEQIGYEQLYSDVDVAKVSVIGVGMRSHAGIAKKMFKTLADKGINLIVISTSEIKISVLIEEEYMELAIRALHTAYGLDEYGDFLLQSDLLPKNLMVAFPCGTSWKENIECGLYSELADRNPKYKCNFIGIYHDKKISHIGKIVASIVYDNKEHIEIEKGDIADKDMYINKIKLMIGKAGYFDLKSYKIRYYIVDEFKEISFSKISKHGMQNHRYFDLAKYGIKNSDSLTTKEVAERLKGEYWE